MTTLFYTGICYFSDWLRSCVLLTIELHSYKFTYLLMSQKRLKRNTHVDAV